MGRAQQIESLLIGVRDTSGRSLSGGRVYAYSAGTTSFKDLYTEQDKSNVATNPLILDSIGSARVYADGFYKLVIKTSADAHVLTLDNLVYGLPDEAAIWCGDSTGSADAYILTPSPALLALSHGMNFSFIANFTNSGASTVNISGLGAIAAKRANGDALSASDITSGNITNFIYDTSTGTPRLLLASASAAPSFSSVTVSGLTASSLVATDGSKVLTSSVSGLSPAMTGLTLSGLTANSLLYGNGSKALTSAPTGLTPEFTGLTLSSLTASKVMLSGASKQLVSSTLAEADIVTHAAPVTWDPLVKGVALGGVGRYVLHGKMCLYWFCGTYTLSGGGFTYSLPLAASASSPAQAFMGYGTFGGAGVHGLLNSGGSNYCDVLKADGSTIIAGGPSVFSLSGIYEVV